MFLFPPNSLRNAPSLCCCRLPIINVGNSQEGANRNQVAWNNIPFYSWYIMVKIGAVLNFQTLRLSQHSISSTNATSPVHRKAIKFWLQGWRVFGINHQRQLVIVAHELYLICLLFKEACSSWSQWYSFWNSNIPTSLSVLKQIYWENTNGQNDDDEVKKTTLGSHSVSVNCCNILTYFYITNNKVMRSP